MTDLDKKWRKLGIPIVNIHSGNPIPGLVQVGVDDFAVGQMAADYLIDIGCQTLAMMDNTTNNCLELTSEP